MSQTVEQLGQAHASAVRALLSKDPVHNLYLLGLLEEFGLEAVAGQPGSYAFHGCLRDGALAAVLFVGGTGGLVVPSVGDPRDFGHIAERLHASVEMRACLGEPESVDVLVRHLCASKPRVSRSGRLFKVSADDLGPFTNPTLRLATGEDLPELLELSVAAVRERMGRDPLAEDPDAFRERVHRRIRGKRTYVLAEKGRLIFKIDIGSRSQFGAELEGVFTRPEERGKGHATLSVGQISRHLLSSLPRLTLRVDERDPGLAVIARKVGFLPCRSQRLVLAE